MKNNILFNAEQFSRIFPYSIMIDSQLVVQSNGKTLEKLYPNIAGKPFEEKFTIVRPEVPKHDLSTIQSLTNQMVVIECNNEQKTILRGQIEWMPLVNSLLFMGSPWFDSIEQVIENKLSLHDFAYHDPMIDLLHVLKTQEITTGDLKHLLKTVNKQKNELKKAAKEIREIALFPTQNPDPLIRINLEGKILQTNPSADKLTNFQFNDETYSSEVFWKYISENLDPRQDRIIVEASSDNEVYSFVIMPLPDSGYYNIYGRKITEQKKNQEQLQILSSIAAENTHGVVIADREGRIEWVNNSFEAITGYTLKEIIGKKPGNLLQGPDTDPKMIEYLRNQIKKGEPFTCEILNYSKSKNPYWLRIQGQALKDEKGNITKYFAIEQDISLERENQKKIREFEDRLRMALDKIGDYVWEHDFRTGKSRFSKAENHFLGLADISSVDINIAWWNSIHKEDLPMLEEGDRKYRNGEASDHTHEYRMVSKDGSVKWVLDRGVVIERDSEGKPLVIIGTHTDITRQKNIELEMGATANRLSSLIQNLYAGVLLENENRTIGLLNQRFCDLFGIPVEPTQLIGTDCSHAVEQSKHLFKNPASFVKRINGILESKKLVVNEMLEMVNGKYLERDFIPIWNKGIYSGNLWLYTDITEKINAEKKLEEQRIFYEQILNNTPADIAVFDNEHHYLFINPQAIRNPELRSWLIGKKDEDYVARKNLPMSIVENRRKLFNTALHSKKLHSFEEELKQPDGSSRFILRNLYPILNTEDEVELVVGYGIDITNIKLIQHQIKESEKRYRDVIENSLALVTTHDLEGMLISANPMVGKIYGYSNEELVGRCISDFIPEEDKHPFFDDYLSKINSQKEDSGIFRVISKSGKIVYTLYNNFLKEEPGRDPYVIGFAVDITDRIQAEKELRIAKKTTEELAEAKQSFLANMSHEIRTPMNAIMGMSSQLAKTDLTDQQKFYLDTIHRAADNLLVIINDILDLSKIDAGKLGIEEIGFEPKVVVGTAMQVLMYKAEEKGIKLTNSYCDSKLSKVLIGDPHRLNQILLNLISNAIKFTEKGSVDITCEVVKDTSTSQVVRAKVIDTGIGMEEEFVKNLFQKFNQEDISVSRKFGGTGLGMSITHQLIKLMGGKIMVKSKKNRGTKVTFEIEFKKGRPKDLPVKNINYINTTILTDKKILVVDDNDMNRLVATTMLQNYHAKTLEAANGREAIDIIEEIKPDIILMDLQMPVLNGLEATKIIRLSGNQIPIIALTANAIKGENEKCFAVGMNDYISKPYTEDVLLQKVAKWLDSGNSSPSINKTKQEIPKKELYNLSVLEEISRGNQVFVKKMIDLFCSQTPYMLSEMIKAYNDGDLEKMGAVAHKMKPSIDNLKILSLKQEIRTIEKARIEKISTSEIEAILEKIDSVIKQVIYQMNS